MKSVHVKYVGANDLLSLWCFIASDAINIQLISCLDFCQNWYKRNTGSTVSLLSPTAEMFSESD